MKINAHTFNTILTLSLSLLFVACAGKKELRTDGVPGSGAEYADFSKVEGQLQVGGQFGAILPSTGDDSNFSLGADLDFRPYSLFGGRLTYFQGLNSPVSAIVAATPLIHSQFANLTPYAMFGPGVAIINFRHGTKMKFDISAGAGADVELIAHWSLGMVYMWNMLIDAPDLHSIAARFSYAF